MDFDQFNQVLREFAEQDVPEIVSTVQRQLCLDGLTRLVERTPVDTGRARGNWQVGINDRPSDEIEPSLGPKHKKDERLTEAPSVSSMGQDTIEAGKAIIETLPPYSVCYVTNNCHYIDVLEDGHSGQCPPGGMLVLTFEELAGQL